MSNVIITKSSHELAAEPKMIYKFLKSQKINAHVANSVKEALSAWDKKIPLLITGSLFTVADALNYLDA